MCNFLILNVLFVLASASAGRFGFSFAFITGFVAKTQAPPLLLGLRASLYRPNQHETIAMGDGYILCGRSGVSWSAWAAHRQRCERFLFAAGCSMKELLTITHSSWPRMPLSRVCWLSVTERSVLCPLSSGLLCCCSVSSLRRTCCHPGGRARMWRSRSSLRGYYFGAVAPRFLAAFHRLCVVAKRVLV